MSAPKEDFPVYILKLYQPTFGSDRDALDEVIKNKEILQGSSDSHP